MEHAEAFWSGNARGGWHPRLMLRDEIANATKLEGLVADPWRRGKARGRPSTWCLAGVQLVCRAPASAKGVAAPAERRQGQARHRVFVAGAPALCGMLVDLVPPCLGLTTGTPLAVERYRRQRCGEALGPMHGVTLFLVCGSLESSMRRPWTRRCVDWHTDDHGSCVQPCRVRRDRCGNDTRTRGGTSMIRPSAFWTVP
jgi:hypothetical protein